MVQPWLTNKSFKTVKLSNSTKVFVERYPISMIGTTISFAGKPSNKARIITPSSPKITPTGFKIDTKWFKTEIPPILTLAITQISTPAGIATLTALPSTNIALFLTL